MKRRRAAGKPTSRARNSPEKVKNTGVSPKKTQKRQTPPSLQRRSQHSRTYAYWPAEDRIRWVEWAELRLVQKLEPPTSYGFDRRDTAIWLAKERDKLSWPKIARQFYGSEEQRFILRARRSYARVDRNHPGTLAGGCRPRAPKALLAAKSSADSRPVRPEPNQPPVGAG